MVERDFDVAALAKYLHLTPPQVERLAERGKVPGRKVAGKWRFSHADIHHWMEERMGLLEDGELAQVEDVLERPAAGDQPISIASMLPIDAIAVPLPARTKGSVVKAMVKLAAQTELLWDPAKLENAVRAREQLQSTAMDNGVALLHPRRPLPGILAESFLALGITHGGIPFGGSRRLTDVFFLVCSTNDREHLRLLARLSRVINDQALLESLRAAPDKETVLRLLTEREATLEN